MKLKNCSGSVHKQSGNRSHPFIARKTIGWSEEGKQLYKTIGYSYSCFNERFKNLMSELKMEHKPHDGRHTFATKMTELNANKLHIKLILGHTIDDITENTYIHVKLEDLINTINLFKRL